MALAEDFLKGNLLLAAAVGATALVLPKLMPDLSPSLRSAVASGLSLFLEAESEAEAGIIERLADVALRNVLKSLSGPGSEEDRKSSARAAVHHYKRTARTRAGRYARNEHNRSARYERHIAALRRALERAEKRRSGAKAAALREISALLNEA